MKCAWGTMSQPLQSHQSFFHQNSGEWYIHHLIWPTYIDWCWTGQSSRMLIKTVIWKKHSQATLPSLASASASASVSRPASSFCRCGLASLGYTVHDWLAGQASKGRSDLPKICDWSYRPHFDHWAEVMLTFWQSSLYIQVWGGECLWVTKRNAISLQPIHIVVELVVVCQESMTNTVWNHQLHFIRNLSCQRFN